MNSNTSIPFNRVTVSFGSNYGDRRANVETALEWFKSIAFDIQSSSVYETPEVHGYGDLYMNAVAKGSLRLDHDTFNFLTKQYELDHGRNRERRCRGEVPIDIDIVVWNKILMRPKDFTSSFFQQGLNEIYSQQKDLDCGESEF